MIINIVELLEKGYLKQVENGYLLNPKAPNDVKKDMFKLNEEYRDTLGVDVIFYGDEKYSEDDDKTM